MLPVSLVFVHGLFPWMQAPARVQTLAVSGVHPQDARVASPCLHSGHAQVAISTQGKPLLTHTVHGMLWFVIR